MGKVLEIGISENSKGEIRKQPFVEAIAGKGLINDRHHNEGNKNKNQITLIEIENIELYNQISGTSIRPIDFRRNIITKGIKLNELVGAEFFIGKVKVKGHDLCRPCKELQDRLGQENFVKKLIDKGGLRCEILSNGKISIGDKILK